MTLLQEMITAFDTRVEYNVLAKHPMKTVRAVDMKLATWKLLNLEKKSTKDCLFTLILMQSLTQHRELYAKVWNKLQIIMAQYEQEDIPRPSNDMTIYRSICKYVESIEQVTTEINMTHKIEEVCRDNNIDHTTKKKYVPMTQAGYVLNVQQMEDEERKKPLSEKKRALYMKIVGSLIWISGV
jgi:hypothetical protein